MNMDTSMVDEVDPATIMEIDSYHRNDNNVVGIPVHINANLAVADAVVVEALDDTPNYFDWNKYCPALQIFVENIPTLQKELQSLVNQPWMAWPENHVKSTVPASDQPGTDGDLSSSWTVIPFLHTFPATDPTASTWIKPCANLFPKTVEMLKKIPNIRTALYSRLKPNTKLVMHTGWEDLANYVLRCHICVDIPPDACGECGLWVDGEVQKHFQGGVIIFDDSKDHYAYNNSSVSRVVLIIDIMRPPDMHIGRCVGGHTEELDNFISKFS